MISFLYILISLSIIITLFVVIASFTWFLKYISRPSTCRYKPLNEIRNRKKEERESDVDTFEIPLSYRAVPVQISSYRMPNPKMSTVSLDPSVEASYNVSNGTSPFLTNYNINNSSFTSNDGIRQLKNDHTVTRRIRIASIKEGATSFKEKQKNNSFAILKHLIKQGKYVSSQRNCPALFSEHPELDKQLNEDYRPVNLDGGTSYESNSKVRDKRYIGEDLFESTVVSASNKHKITKQDSNSNKEETRKYKKSGRVTFTTLYNEADKSLQIDLIQGFDFAVERDLSKLNPYLKLYLGADKRQVYKTQYQKGTRNPYINECAIFRGKDKTSLTNINLEIKAYNYSRMKKKELIGEVEIPLNSLNTELKEMFHVNLFKAHKEYDRGVALISIRHQAIAAKMEVSIPLVRNLPKELAVNDLYARATIYGENKVETKETFFIQNEKHVVSEEVLELSVATNVETPLEFFSLVVSVIKRNVIGRDEIIGHVVFSRYSPQESAVNQWQSVVANPHERIIEWHDLCDPTHL